MTALLAAALQAQRSGAAIPASDEPAVVLDGVRRVYRATRAQAARAALDGVSLRIERGAWLALLGPNGSGKSTLLRILSTLDRPDQGRAVVLGQPLPAGGRSLRALRARIGVVFQTAGLDPILTVRENFLAQAALAGITGAEARRRAVDAGARAGVAGRLNDRVGRLSGGLARRVDLARALIADPELLLLDEPTTGLDHESRAAFIELLEQRRAETSLTIVMSTHLMDEAERAGRVALISRGKIVAEGSPDELRRELGGRVISTGVAFGAVLESAGLRVTRHSRAATASGDETAVEHAVRELTRAGAAFSVGPPTLGDVYLARTGESLAERTP